jgi:hypothetical protein
MKNKSKGYSLDFMAGYYDKLTFTERSRFRREQLALIGLAEGEIVAERTLAKMNPMPLELRAKGPAAEP